MFIITSCIQKKLEDFPEAHREAEIFQAGEEAVLGVIRGVDGERSGAANGLVKWEGKTS